MPNVNFESITRFAAARYWAQATPEQQQRIQEEFKTLLLRTYSGALSEVKDQTLSFRPFRANPRPSPGDSACRAAGPELFPGDASTVH